MNKTVFWLTGLPNSGKTTLSKELSRHIHAEILDGGEIRKLANNFDFSKEGRARHMRTVAEMAYKLSKYTPVIVALVSPIKDIREEIMKKYGNFIEIYVKCSVGVCAKRDKKDLYQKAIKGEINNFTGISDPYEEPTNATIVNTEKLSPEECAKKILDEHPQNKKYSMFIGRWQPLHEGHQALFDSVRQEGKNILIGVRNTGIDENNPFSIAERIKMIKTQIPDAEIIVMPDIEELVIGRKVGYKIREIKLDKEIESISGTKIRNQMKINNK